MKTILLIVIVLLFNELLIFDGSGLDFFFLRLFAVIYFLRTDQEPKLPWC